MNCEMVHIVYLAMPFNNFYSVCVRERERELYLKV